MITSLKEILTIRNICTQKKQKVIFTNGCFDILHSGHCSYLNIAKKFGDIMIVGLNSDDSVRKLKGNTRPINKQEDRAYVLSSLRSVDYVVLFEEDTPLDLITAILPDILIKGNDYEICDIAGADVVLKNGGDVITIPLVEGQSTTNTINKINNQY